MLLSTAETVLQACHLLEHYVSSFLLTRLSLRILQHQSSTMCGTIYNVYRGCGHELDSGDVEPCEDGILTNKICVGPDGKHPGEPFDQIVHTQCPPCAKAQQELDAEIDSPQSSHVSEAPSKRQQKRAQPPVSESSTRASRQSASEVTASTRRSRRVVPDVSEPATSDRGSRATSRLTARQAEKQPVYKAQEAASSIAPSDTSSEVTSTATTKLSRGTSKASRSHASSFHRAPREEHRVRRAAPYSQMSASDVEVETIANTKPQAMQADRNVPRSMLSSRSGASDVGAGRAPHSESVTSSNYASTVRQSRQPHGHEPSRMSSRRSASTRHNSHASRSRRSADPKSSSSSRRSRRHDDQALAYPDSTSAVSRDMDSQYLQPPANIAPGKQARDEADQHLESARSNLQQKMVDHPSSKGSKRSLLSRMTGLMKGNSVHNGQRDLSVIDEGSEASSVPRAMQPAMQQPAYTPPLEPAYMHADVQPARSEPANSLPPARNHNESYEQISARLLAEEEARGRQLEQDLTVARQELREAEDRAFDRDTELALEHSQTLSPHEQWQETNLLRQAMHASLQHQRDSIERAAQLGGQTTQLVFEQCGHRVAKDAAAYTDQGRPAPRFIHQKGLCDNCQARAQPSSELPFRSGAESHVTTAIPEIVVEPSSTVRSRRQQRQVYQPTESPTMASSERAEVRRPPPSFASSSKRKKEVPRAVSVAPSEGVPVDKAMRSQGSEEASRRRLFDKKNKEYAEYQRRHPNGTDTEDEDE